METSILEKLDTQAIEALLSIVVNDKGDTILKHTGVENIIPLLRKLDNKAIVKFLIMQFSITPHNKDIIEFISFCENWEKEKLLELVPMCINEKFCDIVNKIFFNVLFCYKDYTAEQIDGIKLIFSKLNFELLDVNLNLDKINIMDLIKISSIEDHDEISLVYYLFKKDVIRYLIKQFDINTLKIEDAIPYLKKLNARDFLLLIFLKDKNGCTILSHFYEHIIELFKNLDVSPYVHSSNSIFSWIIPYVSTLDFNDLVKFLFIRNKNDHSFDDYLSPIKQSIFNRFDFFRVEISKILPFFEKGPESDFKNLRSFLSFKDRSGCTFLHFNDHVKTLMPFLEQLVKHLKLDGFLCLAKNNNDGETPIFVCFKALLPVLKQLRINDLLCLLSMPNKKGETVLSSFESVDFLFDESSFDSSLSDFSSRSVCKLPVNDLVKLIFSKDMSGNIFWCHLLPQAQRNILSLFNQLNFNDLKIGCLLHHLKELPVDDQIKFLTVQDKRGGFLWSEFSLFETFAPFINQLSFCDLIKLLSVRNTNEETAFSQGFDPSIFERFDFNEVNLDFDSLKDLPINDFIKLLFVRDRSGNTLTSTFDEQEMDKLIPIFRKLKFNELNTKELALYLNELPFNCLIKFLQLCDMNISIFFCWGLIEGIFPRLEKMNNDELIQIFSIRDYVNTPAFFRKSYFKAFLPLIAKLDNDSFVKLMCLRDKAGSTALHSFNGNAIFYYIYPILNRLDSKYLNIIFSMQDQFGNTILHHLKKWEFLTDPGNWIDGQSLLCKLGRKVFLLRNKDGFTAEERHKIQLSNKWLVKDKDNVKSSHISKENYKELAKQLKVNIDKLWDSSAVPAE